MLFRLDGTIPFQNLETVVEVLVLLFVQLQTTETGCAYMTPRWKLRAKVYVLVLSYLQFSFQGLTQERIQ